MRNHQQHHLIALDAQWFASMPTFCTGTVPPTAVATRKVRATKIDPSASGGPVKGGNP
jgi:hypothetical protein